MARTTEQAKRRDSIERMLYRLGILARKPIIREGVVFAQAATEIYVSPALLRTFHCKVGCIACCSIKITVDFSPEEFASLKWSKKVRDKAESLFFEREIEVNGKRYPIFTYNQYQDPACQFLAPIREGQLGCSFYPYQPLECASAPQLSMTTHGGKSIVTKRPFGRAAQWTNVPQCEFSPIPKPIGPLLRTVDKSTVDDPKHPLANEIGLLQRYQYFADYFEIDTYVGEVIAALGQLPEILAQVAASNKDNTTHMIRIV